MVSGNGMIFEESRGYSMAKHRKRVLIPLAPGFEEIEAIGPADVLARAGIRPVLAALPGGDRIVAGSHRLAVHTDASLEGLSLAEFAGICLPGGMPGAQNLMNSSAVGTAVRTIAGNGGLVAALCAAPLVLQTIGLIEGKRLTSHPSVREQLHGCVYTERPVVVDPPLVTSRGPGTALLFGLTIATGLLGAESALALAEKMIVAIPEIVHSEWARFESEPS